MVDAVDNSFPPSELSGSSKKTIKELFAAARDLDETKHPSSQEVVDLLRDVHMGVVSLPEKNADEIIDRIVFDGVDTFEVEQNIRPEQIKDLQGNYPDEFLWLESKVPGVWTSYESSRQIIGALNLTQEDTFYDLGAGYGRTVLYAGAVTDAKKCKGIELVDSRFEVGQSASRRLGLQNVEMIKGNVIDQDFSDGNVFFMYNSFSPDTFSQVLDTLRHIAQGKGIKIVTRGMGQFPFEDTRWLEKEKGFIDSDQADVVIYKSVPERRRKIKDALRDTINFLVFPRRSPRPPRK